MTRLNIVLGSFRRRSSAFVLAGATLCAAVPATAPVSTASPPGPRQEAAIRPGPRTVTRSEPVKHITLITGDRVRVTPRAGKSPQVMFEPAPNGVAASAVTTYADGHTYVIPSVARADVVSGRLDSALFDITTLLAERRDDASSKTLPVIVRYAGTRGAATARARQTPLRGVEESRVLASISARAASVQKTAAREFWTALAPGAGTRLGSAVQRVSLDRRVRVDLDRSVPQIGAPPAWQRGLTGKGVKIAILDTGIDPTHPDLAGRIALSENFSDSADSVDHFGHGTHVASIAAGTGAASGSKYKGVAPDATLLNGKVLDDDGGGTFSGIIAGMEWAAAQGASVVNMSLGSFDPSDGTDEVSLAVNRLSRDTGTLFVVAAGNCFDIHRFAVTAPAAADEAVAVGNLQRDGVLNDTSCRGPRIDGGLKPEISAPGTDIVAARADGTQIGEPVGDHYTTLSGTSMATPHVAGTAALVAQAHPDWNATRLKARLISTADPQQGRVDEEGAGRVDADQATGENVAVDTGELELGTLRWPYPAKEEITRELTYHNSTGSAVALRLSASFESAEATPKLSAAQVVVPANGDATVTVTADRAAAGPGYFSGRIFATPDGADPIVTTVGWYTEPELYDLTVKGVGIDGLPLDMGFNIGRLDGDHPEDLDPVLPMENGIGRVRLAPGRYVATAITESAATDATPVRFDLVVGDEVLLTKDATVTLDMRTSRPVAITTRAKDEVRATDRTMSYLLQNADGEVTGGFLIDVGGYYEHATYNATPSRRVTAGSSEFVLGAELAVPPYRAAVQGGGAFTVSDFANGPRFTGTKDLRLYDAGGATPDELAGVTGKLALIRRGDAETRDNSHLVKAAEDAGAAAALVYNADHAGIVGEDGRWNERDQPDPGVTIPAMRTSRVTARMLLDRLKAAPVTVRIIGQALSPYIYDLAQPWSGRIPAVGTVNVRSDQLARVDEEFGAHVAGTSVYAPRGGRTPGGTDVVGRSLFMKAPGRMVTYVQANQTVWSTSVSYDSDLREEFYLFSPGQTYRPGEHQTIRWLRPVQNSGLPDVQFSEPVGVRRFEGGLLLQAIPFGQRQQYSDTESGGPTELALERNGEHIATVPTTGMWVADDPGDAAGYRAVLDTSRVSDLWKYSTRVKTVWTWRSSGAADEVMPLVLADVDVPQADVLNKVRAGMPVTIGLDLRHQAGSKSRARFTEARLELSYDGSRWTELPLTKTGDGRYVTRVSHPVAEAGKAPSLRLTGTDADGNKIEQEITGAYGLSR